MCVYTVYRIPTLGVSSILNPDVESLKATTRSDRAKARGDETRNGEHRLGAHVQTNLLMFGVKFQVT